MVSPNGELVADIYQKLPGKHALYIGAYPDVIERLVKSDAASVWLNQAVTISPKFGQELSATLERAVMDTLAMANKARQTVLGIDTVLHQMTHLGLLIVAQDAGRSSFNTIRRHHQLHNDLPMVHYGTRQSLGQACGRHSQVFLGVQKGKMAKKLHFFMRCSTRFTTHYSL